MFVCYTCDSAVTCDVLQVGQLDHERIEVVLSKVQCAESSSLGSRGIQEH